MKTVSKELFTQLGNYMNKKSRSLEKALFNYYFNNSNGEDILDALEKFQNTDGGFGQGIEPDFKLKESSPMATSIGLRYLNLVDNNDRCEKMIAKAIRYLENTFNDDKNGWYSVPSSVNDYPHAPWWEYKKDINMTVIDYSWGNPTAELVGYLYKYRRYLKHIDIYKLVDYAIEKLNERKEFKSEHEIFCYIKMYNIIDQEFSRKMKDTLKIAVKQLVNTDKCQWTDYVPTPVRFIEFKSKDYFGIDNKSIDDNLDYLIDLFEQQGKILPTWEWGVYLEQWEISREEWTGILTFRALVSLLKFNRIEI
ncbi:hypothetical protein [Dethiothermospora halolimnae]|uniref:hypothetical protein n=1 Tax=Dethiothermospora halolimnae TaxID=3114390 RepID=UPI003CCBC58F